MIVGTVETTVKTVAETTAAMKVGVSGISGNPGYDTPFHPSLIKFSNHDFLVFMVNLVFS